MNIDFSVGDGAASIDTVGRTVTRKSGKKLTYGALLLATGAEPRRLPIPGADAATVHVLRTLADSRAIIAKAKEGARAVVIGSSFIGLEAAASLRARKVEVDVVSVDKVPLARVVGDTIGGYVRKLHEEHGVRFHLGPAPKAISDRGVELDDGTLLPADFVVLGVGVAPRTATRLRRRASKSSEVSSSTISSAPAPMESMQPATSRRFPTSGPVRACASSIGRSQNAKDARSRAPCSASASHSAMCRSSGAHTTT